MKKVLTNIMVILGILAVAIGIHWKSKDAITVSIIGGADGPTSVFLAGRVGDGVILGVIVVGIILASIGIIVYRKISKK